MKQYLLLLLQFLLLPGALLAQVKTDNTQLRIVRPPDGGYDFPYLCWEEFSTYQLTADSVMQSLDKTQIPSGILYDRTAGIAGLDGFGRAHGDADTSSVHHFFQAYYELRASNYNEPGNKPCRSLLANNADYLRRRDTIVLGALRFRFHTLDTLALRDNLLRIDSSASLPRLFDVAGRSRSPYVLNEVAIAAAMADSLNSSTATFRLAPGYLFTNSGATLTSASVWFDNGGGANTLTPGQNVQISYGSKGWKTLRYVLTYSDGNQYTAYSRLWVGKASCSNCRTLDNDVLACHTEPLTSDIAHQAGAAAPGIGLKGLAEISYYYSPTTSSACSGFANVKKPVVVIDGIDHDQERNGTQLFNKYLFYTDGQGREQNLGSELRQQGYDIVIMDPPIIYNSGQIVNGQKYKDIARRSGSDYMERNAYTLVKLIQELNRQMKAGNPASTEKIVVIGPSMGGQIARFALAYMEKRYNDPSDAAAYQNPLWNHNTRLFISLDSPNNGATIPLGLQHFVRIFAEGTEKEDLKNSLEELNSPAARELVLQHHTQGTASLPDPLRTNFVNTISGFGNYPGQLRQIAVTNGALDGTRQRDQNGVTIQAGQQAFFLEKKGVPSGGVAGTVVRLFWYVLGPITRAITTASARVYYSPEYGQVGRVARTYLFVAGRHHGERTPEATALANSCSLDGAPGGYRTFFNAVKNSGPGEFFFEALNIYDLRDKTCFIPTLSGLGYTQPADNCLPAGQNLVCAGTTPFDAYYGPADHNEDHIQLTPANVTFMRNEILRITPTPVFTVVPTAMCSGGTATFSIAPECTRAGQPATTYFWTPGPDLTIVSGQGTTTVVVQSAGSSSSNATVQVVATRTGYAASAPAAASVYVGVAYAGVDGPGGTRCYSEDFTYSLSSAVLTQGAPQWNAYLNGVLRNDMFVNSTATTVTVFPEAGTLYVTATLASQCAGQAPVVATSPYANVIEFYRGSHGFEPCPIREGRPAPKARPAAYPNPADDVLTLATPETLEMATPRTAVLYNGQGREVRRTRVGEARLPTADLPAGLYYLMVTQNGQVTRTQIRVQH